MQTELFEVEVESKRQGAPAFLRVNGKEFRVSTVFGTYWKFAAERHSVFQRKQSGELSVTKDPIIRHFKFTNAFRILDRTSQYLVKNVIQTGEQSLEDLFFRIILFKLFNKIETWELLMEQEQQIRLKSYNFERYDRALSQALAQGQRIYSAAYIMPSGGANGDTRKHRSHLRLLECMLKDELPRKLADCETMKDGFLLLKEFPMIGDFLAYQFITDINYSSITHFSEMEFVVAGPGALDGLKKCFPEMTPGDASMLIRVVCEDQERFQSDHGVEQIHIFGRRLQLIDCQNLFCETDKYARIAHPDIQGYSGRTRVKQAYHTKGKVPAPVFPHKWNISMHDSNAI